MKFLMDVQQDTLRQKIELFPELVCGQLLTPLTKYACWGGKFAVDNGAFSGFPEASFKSLLQRNESNKENCLFVCCPDVVGNGRRTLEIWKHRHRWLNGWPAALVLQNGVEDLDIPWHECSAVFVGGVDPWKESQACEDLVRTAKVFGLIVHVGRVNTYKRFIRFRELGADYCDGSGIARYDHMLEEVDRRLNGKPERNLFTDTEQEE